MVSVSLSASWMYGISKSASWMYGIINVIYSDIRLFMSWLVITYMLPEVFLKGHWCVLEDINILVNYLIN